ncbi:hypothetical protein XELAEV_18046301mg [Xenopus laevis]|uniref:Uncharacterized protein n=1 Tax=Xenopus laevis TaxID=8355 RepID=A0A974BTJ8_XENLA|nr:hypothetical protein XELAEV_18046301mg [Xenopus laevis]
MHSRRIDFRSRPKFQLRATKSPRNQANKSPRICQCANSLTVQCVANLGYTSVNSNLPLYIVFHSYSAGFDCFTSALWSEEKF